MSISKNPQRSGENDDEANKKIDYDKNVSKYLMSGDNDHLVMSKLMSKYGSNNKDVINNIYKKFKKSKEKMIKRASQFKKIIFDRYGELSPTLLIKKAKKYSTKYKIGDDSFNYFFHLVVSDSLLDSSVTFNLPNTKISKTLGYGSAITQHDKLNINASDLQILQDVLRIHGETKLLHSQIILQSLAYRDCAPEAISGQIKGDGNVAVNLATDKYNYYSYIHPILAALFLPKFPIIDERMLLANIGSIIKAKYDGIPIATKPDFELYWDMISDPNDNVCHISNAMEDLKMRYILQTKIWEAVINLRQGKYYATNLGDFLAAVETCRNNIYDCPDLTYVKDEGTIIRRILTAFSLRPTIVSTSRLNSLSGITTFGVNPGYFTSAGINSITTIPMITLRIPVKQNSKDIRAVSLNDALVQPQWFVENKMLIPKSQNIVHSRDVLIFYVNRRFKSINIANINYPYNFQGLPMTISGFEQLNDFPVSYEHTISSFRDDKYILKSVVFVEVAKNRSNLIVGSSTGIVIDRYEPIRDFGKTHIIYDPQGSAEMFKADNDNYYSRTNPIFEIPGETQYAPTNNSIPESFASRASTRGTIFIYKKTINPIKDKYDVQDQTFIR